MDFFFVFMFFMFKIFTKLNIKFKQNKKKTCDKTKPSKIKNEPKHRSVDG